MKRLNLSYIHVVVKPKRQSYILDDEDVFVYLTSMDKDQRRSILHVEGIMEGKKVPITEQLSRTEKASSFGRNFSELSSGVPEVECNSGEEQHVEVQEGMETVVTRNEEDVGFGGENVQRLENVEKVENAENMVKAEKVESVEKVENVEKVGTPVYSRARYVDLQEWEDGMGIEMGLEFPSKEAVKDLIDRASKKNCFGIFVLKSDTSWYGVRFRGAEDSCEWYVRATNVRNSEIFSIRRYTKMHACSRENSAPAKKRKGNPQMVAAIIKNNFPRHMETPDPRTRMTVAVSNKCFKQDGCPYDMHDLFTFCSPYYLRNIVPEETKKLYALLLQYTKRQGRVKEKRYPSVGKRRKKNKIVRNRGTLESYLYASEGTQGSVGTRQGSQGTQG
ncbi:unnamed protein product [Brassica oleracea]